MHAMRRSRYRILFIVAVVLLGSLVSGAAVGQDCWWDRNYPDMLGISIDPEPLERQPIAFVEAVVTDPEKLAGLGLYGVKPGDTVKMLCMEDNRWRIKHYATGLSIVFATAPVESHRLERFPVADFPRRIRSNDRETADDIQMDR